MQRITFFILVISLFACSEVQETTNKNSTMKSETSSPEQAEFAFAIHGGAGTLLKENMTPEKDKEYRAKLTEALQIGHAILAKGGSSTDAVEAAIVLMEDSPLFNAGKGAVYTNDQVHELDASIMEGNGQNAGAVASLSNIKNPIKAARKVMEESVHVMMAGLGAEKFAEELGLETVENSYFDTERRLKSIKKALKKEQQGLRETQLSEDDDYKFGTVGAIALDKNGNLAAGTSTGGMTNKRYGRIGDSPIIGAGTYANNKTCAVSSTGHGEYFIRGAIAYDVSAVMEYKKLSVKDAANFVIHTKLKELGGTGGVIAMDSYGQVSMPFNTKGMYRGVIMPDGKAKVYIYGDEERF